MSDVSIQKLYSFYEIFNDFSRIRILTCLDQKEMTIDDISNSTGLSVPIVSSQLDYLHVCGIVSQIEVEEENAILFKISDKTMVKIIDNIIKYINKSK